MNLTYIIGTVTALAIMVVGMMFSSSGGQFVVKPSQIMNFFDPSSILIVVGCTLMVVVASFPSKMLKEMPKHFGIMLNTKNLHFHLIVRDLIIAHSHHFSVSAVGSGDIVGFAVIGSCGMGAATRSRVNDLSLFIGCRLSAPAEM